MIPHADTLHIRYLFASEEYPEFVGSVFNDVMAVFVDGVNCAVAPGTTTPVSVNTINQTTNSSWYIDNASGAAGYATTFDGLTRPLTCDVPVTPWAAGEDRSGCPDEKDASWDSTVAPGQGDLGGLTGSWRASRPFSPSAATVHRRTVAGCFPDRRVVHWLHSARQA